MPVTVRFKQINLQRHYNNKVKGLFEYRVCPVKCRLYFGFWAFQVHLVK